MFRSPYKEQKIFRNPKGGPWGGQKKITSDIAFMGIKSCVWIKLSQEKKYLQKYHL